MNGLTSLDGFVAGIYRFDLAAVEEAHDLPREKGIMLRGGFGVALKRSVCAFPDAVARDCAACPLQASCVYPRLFRARPRDVSTALDRDPPRPFVIRIPADRRRHYRPGDLLSVEIVLIGWARAYLPYVSMALADLAEGGLGPLAHRARFALRAVWSLDPGGWPPLRLDAGPQTTSPYSVTGADLCRRAALLPADEVAVTFLTPTRLITADQVSPLPPFHVLAGALRRRALALAHYHCAADWPSEPTSFTAVARHVRHANEQTTWQLRSRRHARRSPEDAKMSMDGLVGTVRYQGDLMPFRPLLALGELVHVGKHTAFGHGRFRCTPPDPALDPAAGSGVTKMG